MDTILNGTNTAMIKRALKTLSNDQLAYALDTGVRFLDTWRVQTPTKLSDSDNPVHGEHPMQLKPNSTNLTRPIRKSRKQSSLDLF